MQLFIYIKNNLSNTYSYFFIYNKAWFCTFHINNEQICGKCFSTPEMLNNHARISHTKFHSVNTVTNKVQYAWWCGTCGKYVILLYKL